MLCIWVSASPTQGYALCLELGEAKSRGFSTKLIRPTPICCQSTQGFSQCPKKASSRERGQFFMHHQLRTHRSGLRCTDSIFPLVAIEAQLLLLSKRQSSWAVFWELRQDPEKRDSISQLLTRITHSPPPPITSINVFAACIWESASCCLG